MRIAVVGPAYPIKGGIAQHTTLLAHRLAAAGHDVELVSWSRQYPARLYPGEQHIAAAEHAPFARTSRPLAWNRPDSWVRTGRRLRDRDLVVVVHVTSVQALPYRVLLGALGDTPTVVLAHNVLPHEPGRLDRPLVGALLGRAGRVLVHGEEQAALARTLTHRPVTVAAMAPHAPFAAAEPDPGVHHRLLMFGLIRPYKGLDLLLAALPSGPPGLRLRVAGEFWGGTAPYVAQAARLGIADRVELLPGYVPADAVPELARDVDALALPYRSATGSQAVAVAAGLGLPVIVTRVGELAAGVRDGVDGLVVVPDDVEALTAALHRLYAPGAALALRAAVAAGDPGPGWDRYLAALLPPVGAVPDSAVVHASRRSPPVPHDVAEPVAAPPGGAALHLAKRVAEEVLWARVALQRRVLPASRGPLPTVPPTDVLRTRAEYEAAARTTRRLRLPLHPDKPKNWDALGAVLTIVGTLGRDIRVLDAGAARYSTVLPALKLLGVRDLVGNNLEFTRTRVHDGVRFEPGDITAMPYADGSLDAITCMSVIEHGVPLSPFALEAARTLRPGGLLVVSTDYDQEPPDVTGRFAYGVPVMIFGPDQIRGLVSAAADAGLDLVGELALEHPERPLHWKRTGLDFTFIRLTFVRRAV